MKFFELSLTGMVIRFYLMMVVVITAGFTGIWAIALLALPIFISGMVGMSVGKSKVEPVAKPTPASEVTSAASVTDSQSAIAA